MACESRVLVVHVHGHEADIESFFDGLIDAMYGVVQNIPALYPSVEVITSEEDELAGA